MATQIAPIESDDNLKELLEELKGNGVEVVLLFISDSLKGVVEAVFKGEMPSFSCLCARNIMYKVLVKDRKEVCEDFKTIHQAKDSEVATQALEQLSRNGANRTKKSHIDY